MKDLSSLPKKGGRSGLLPDAEPRFIQTLVEAWASAKDDDKPTALGTLFRHSDAGKCGRAISYTAAGIPASDPMDLAGVWNTSLGTLLHDEWQAALRARFPDAEIEVKVRTPGVDGSGHIDAVIRGDRIIAYELKTTGGFGYKASIGAKSKGTPAEGPKTEHILQAALNGLAVDADEVVIGYLAKECVSVGQAKTYRLPELERFCAEWTFTREQYEPLAIKESERIDGLLALVKNGTLGRRTIPYAMEPGAEIVEPATGAWTLERDGVTEQTGRYWGCDYCKYQSLCARTEPGRIPVEDVREVAVAMGLAIP